MNPEERFVALIAAWLIQWPDLEGSNDIETKKNINNWLDDFELSFRSGASGAVLAGGFTGFSIAQNSINESATRKLFSELYGGQITALQQTDFTKARLLRNALAEQFGSKYKEMYSDFRTFEATSGGPTAVRVREFMKQPIFKEATNIPVPTRLSPTSVVIRNWEPRAYARMYARTTNRMNEDEIMMRDLIANNQDIVQITDIPTTTPICLKHIGRVFSLTGRTPGFPILEIRAPFHPNCVHRMIPASKVSAKSAQAINKHLDSAFKRNDFTNGQIRSLNKQEDWLKVNRKNPNIGVESVA